MHSTADLQCIQCHVNHMPLDAPNQNNGLASPFVGSINIQPSCDFAGRPSLSFGTFLSLLLLERANEFAVSSCWRCPWWKRWTRCPSHLGLDGPWAACRCTSASGLPPSCWSCCVGRCRCPPEQYKWLSDYVTTGQDKIVAVTKKFNITLQPAITECSPGISNW